ncbi:hypothetical protein SpCBS45565_g04421 [Spizellomyces sp. 'palustris']|nr:hypothetical protein SpCBS45565_g04421 [Spizellomyces sp. 'palustris']
MTDGMYTKRNDTIVEMDSNTVNRPYRFTNEQFEELLNRIAAPPPPPAPASGLGNPGPLGLGSFALTTFVLSCFNAGVFIDKRLEPVVLPLALFYGGIAQFAAGMWEFQTSNTFGATAFTSYGCFWMSFAAYVYLIVPTLEASSLNVSDATGLYLLGWTVFTVYMTFAAYRVSKAVLSVFFFLSITFLLLTIGALAPSAGTTRAGGWFGLITAFCAWYSSAAVVINTAHGREVLPVGAYVRRQARANLAAEDLKV